MDTGANRPSSVARVPLSIVMPAYNEEANIGSTVRQALRVAERYGTRHEVVVVDDGSADRTAAEASSVGSVRVVRHPRNRGYGAAVRTALRAAQMDVILFTDSDRQFDLEEISRLLPRLETSDVVVGYRSSRNDPLIRRVVSGLWNLLVRALYGVSIRDVNCGFKLFRRAALDSIDLRSNGAMVSTELIVKLSHAGRAISEVEVSHHPRTAGTPTGMKPKVVALAFVELVRRYRELSPPSRQRDVARAAMVVGTVLAVWGLLTLLS
jgi:glycosyltransferase involved in cell wall biosynthesis